MGPIKGRADAREYKARHPEKGYGLYCLAVDAKYVGSAIAPRCGKGWLHSGTAWAKSACAASCSSMAFGRDAKLVCRHHGQQASIVNSAALAAEQTHQDRTQLGLNG